MEGIRQYLAAVGARAAEIEISDTASRAIIRFCGEGKLNRGGLRPDRVRLNNREAYLVPAERLAHLIIISPCLVWDTSYEAVTAWATPLQHIGGFQLIVCRKPNGTFRQMLFAYCDSVVVTARMQRLSK